MSMYCWSGKLSMYCWSVKLSMYCWSVSCASTAGVINIQLELSVYKLVCVLWSDRCTVCCLCTVER